MTALAPKSVLLALSLALLPSCKDAPDPLTGPGVPRELAVQRAASIANLRYEAHFDLPAQREEAVTGRVTIRFDFAPVDSQQDLVLDFRAPVANVRNVRVDGDTVRFALPQDHIVIPRSAVAPGARTLSLEFTSTDAALNRQTEFLYALFVPDRASTAMPVFEQPDLKARYTLSLTIPAAWKAVANGTEVARDSSGAARHTVRFAETEPISTYLFSFAAGKLFEESAERDGRTLTMYHRETDSVKVARNRDAIFDLHASSLKWLEDYTGIKYPFGKFAFFAVPAFQFGGMEHPGAIWYRSDGLFLDPTATRNQELGRASVIAHETAHMWFGDLVTMRWFNDVWMKEVFANFMAAKIAGPAFPDINLKLRFFQAHHPSAYGVDRTAGTNAIRQDLENLREAGSLYGAIIYQKAPIVMQQLENLVGPATLQEGLRRYLKQYSYGNASWADLIFILDGLSPHQLTDWSRVWVEEAGRPTMRAAVVDSAIEIDQLDPKWAQRLTVGAWYGDSAVLVRGYVSEAKTRIPLPPRRGLPDFVLGGVDGVSYGRFVMDSSTRWTLLRRAGSLRDPVHRAVAWQGLHEEMLDGLLPPRPLLDAALAAIATERDELVSLQVLGMLRGVYWRFLDSTERRGVAPAVEQALWQALDSAPTAGRKGAFFGAIVGMTLTDAGTARLERVWRKQETPPGLPLTEQQYVNLAEALALRGVPNAEAILDEQEQRITNPDRKERFRFVRPALSADLGERRALFRHFADVDNRRRESWVLDAMGLMNHPLRADAARADLRASLDLVEEIQQTGDIFFPLRWLNATLDGHQSPEAAAIVRTFLEENPELPPRLRGKVLQAADDLYRASGILERAK